jgi:hypothetical protein
VLGDFTPQIAIAQKAVCVGPLCKRGAIPPNQD